MSLLRNLPWATADLSDTATIQLVLRCTEAEVDKIKAAVNAKARSNSGLVYSRSSYYHPVKHELLSGSGWLPGKIPQEFSVCVRNILRGLTRQAQETWPAEDRRSKRRRGENSQECEEHIVHEEPTKKVKASEQQDAEIRTPSLPTLRSTKDHTMQTPASSNKPTTLTLKSKQKTTTSPLQAAEADMAPRPKISPTADQDLQAPTHTPGSTPMTGEAAAPQPQWSIESTMKDMETRIQHMVQTGVQARLAEEKAKWEHDQVAAEQAKTEMWDGKLAEHKAAVSSWRNDLVRREEMVAQQEVQLSELKKMLTEREAKLVLTEKDRERRKERKLGRELTKRETKLLEREKKFAEAMEGMKRAME